MKTHFLMITCALLLLNSCFAREMQLSDDSPFGKSQTGLEIRYEGTSNDGWSPRQKQFNNILTRYMGLQTRPLIKKQAVNHPWVLSLQIEQQESLLSNPFILGKARKSASRLRLEIKAKGVLTQPNKNKTQTFEWVERGDTSLNNKKVLEAQLMDRLGAQIHRSLSPRYVYR